MLEATGEEGIGFTVTLVVVVALVQPFTVTEALYIPAFKIVAFEIEGFCNEDVNPFGPVQEYIAPAIVEAFNKTVFPVHTGELFVNEGGDGIGFTITVMFDALLVQPFTVAVTE